MAKKQTRNDLLFDLLGRVQCVKESCASQADALKTRNDLDWDCYDVGNWEPMADSLEYVESIIRNMLKTKPSNAEKFIKRIK